MQNFVTKILLDYNCTSLRCAESLKCFKITQTLPTNVSMASEPPGLYVIFTIISINIETACLEITF